MAEDDIVSRLPWARGLTPQGYTLSQISKIVESTKWADSLSAKEVETLSRYVHVYTVEAGSVIVQQGRREAYLCLIVEGRVSIMKEGAGRAATQIGSAGAGRIVGEMSLIDGEPRSASVVARFCPPLLRKSAAGGQGPAQDLQADQPAAPADKRSASGLSRRLSRSSW